MAGMRIPDDFISLLLEKIDIVDVISDHVLLKKTGRSLVGLCPFHSEKTPSFHVTPGKGLYYCFGCGAAGTAITFLMEIEQLPFVQVIEKLAQKTGIAMPSLHADAPSDRGRERRMELLRVHELAVKFYNHILMNHDGGSQALQYLLGRGLAKKTVADFFLGYAPGGGRVLVDFLRRRGVASALMVEAGLAVVDDAGEMFDRFRGRVMFPIADGQGRFVGFGGRATGSAQPKYLNSPETALFRKGHLLYAYDRARQAIRKSGRTLLLEGYMDAIALHQHGFANAVAGLGTALTGEQASLLSRVASEVVIVYDGDDAGRSAAVRSAETLRQAGVAVRVAVLPQGVDPDEWIGANSAERFASEVVDQAGSAVLFELRHLTRGHPAHLTTGRIGYLKDAMAVVAREPSALEREAALEWLSETYGMSRSALREDLQLYLRDRARSGAASRARSRPELPGPIPVGAEDIPQAHQAAERQLLAKMLTDATVAAQVQDAYPFEFSVPLHSALQAYLYQFYEERGAADPVVFLSGLDDAAVVSFAVGLLHGDPARVNAVEQEAASGRDGDVVGDCIRCLRSYAAEQEMDRLSARMKLALEQGDAEMLRTLQQRLLELHLERANAKRQATVTG